MLKQLHLKNWRSLRDVTIDFTPITVFIGANSSGKTNIIDALKFVRNSFSHPQGVEGAVLDIGYDAIVPKSTRSKGNKKKQVVEISLISSFMNEALLEHFMEFRFDHRALPFEVRQHLIQGDFEGDFGFIEIPSRENTSQILYSDHNFQTNLLLGKLDRFYTRRWQILSHQLSPAFKISGKETGNRYLIDDDGKNMALILEFIYSAHPELASAFQDDLSYLLPHIRKLLFDRDTSNRDLELFLDEGDAIAAPTISEGSKRVFAMLTALHALEMSQSTPYLSMPPQSWDTGQIPSTHPGLVIIEEPDAALNPGVLENLVNVMRRFTEGDKPRQIILTTHNPTFLNYFKPEEIRVVERDEQGITQVYPVPHDILDDMEAITAMGDMWMTRSIGGLPE